MTKDNSIRQAIILGALLHDIGKFIQRSKENPREKRHQEWGYEWAQSKRLEEMIKDGIRYHHILKREEPKYPQLSVDAKDTNDVWTIFEADNLASGERLEKKQEEADWNPEVPLLSCFSKITLPNKNEKQPSYNGCWKWWPLESLKFVPPQDKVKISVNKDVYKTLWERFDKDFNSLEEVNDVSVLNVLETYTSFIPSETLEEIEKIETSPDISLFDHLKSTAAISCCIYNYLTDGGKEWGKASVDEIRNKSEIRYLLIGGDFSGVQDFIHTITSKGALKGLRGRSFYLELLTEHIVSQIIEKLHLFPGNIIYSGGGSFYILGQNTEHSKKVLTEIKNSFNKWLYETHGVKLYLCLDWVEFCGNAFVAEPSSYFGRKEPCTEKKDEICDLCYSIYQKEKRIITFGDLWGELARKIASRKSQKFIELIDENFFAPQKVRKNQCEICKKDIDGGELCKTCEQLQALGSKLPQIKWIKRSDRMDERALVNIVIEKFYYQFYDEKPESIRKNEKIYRINPSQRDYTANWLWIGNYPQKSREFEELAENSIGAHKLGSLRMDVDNLGMIFSQGLKDVKLRTFSRISSISRFLSYFFKFCINEICCGDLGGLEQFSLRGNGRKERDVVIVYSGGDDLFIVGAWNDVVEVSFDIRNCFKKFTSDNPDINISGGAIVIDHKLPLYQISSLAHEAEEKAKDNEEEETYRKDSIALFYSPILSGEEDKNRNTIPQAFKWEELNETINELVKPIVSIGEFKENRLILYLPRTFIYNLFSISSLWQKEGILYLPYLAYILKRSERKEIIENDEMAKNWGILNSNLMNTQYINKIKLAMTWLDLLVRGGEEKK